MGNDKFMEPGIMVLKQGMETTLGYGLYEIMYELPCLVG